MTEISENVANPFEASNTIKFGAGFDAPWLVLRSSGMTPDEAAKNNAAVLKAFIDNGVPELLSQASTKAQSVYGPAPSGNGPKEFKGGRVVAKESAGDDDCTHGRKLVEKGTWAAMFCQAEPKSSQCDPLWRQKDGTYKAK
ncbi:hypothetical protein [Streptomyces sp. NPDC051561]|uniref:hypothetical protein n=1 Tax=Streptomyces sp. NPDC051561 TaxID=3365658 RepID=UPI0037B706BA